MSDIPAILLNKPCPLVRHNGEGLSAQTIEWLREVGFLQMEDSPTYFYCAEYDWGLSLFGYGELFAGEFANGSDNVEVQLRFHNFPVDRILRRKRLRALLA